MTNKVIGYKLVTSERYGLRDSIKDLENEVSSRLPEWQPVGLPQITNTRQGFHITQNLVKYAQQDEEL